jgi:hypothetical protein
MERKEDRRGFEQDFGGKIDAKRPLGKPRRRWQDNIKTDFQEVGWEGID